MYWNVIRNTSDLITGTSIKVVIWMVYKNCLSDKKYGCQKNKVGILLSL